MRYAFIAVAVAAFVFAGCSTAQDVRSAPAPLSATSPSIVAAVADPRRSDEDRARDAGRRPAETMAFAQIGPGARVGELLAGGGYFSRMFAVAVGDEGRVYPVVRPEGVAANFERPIIEIANDYPSMQVVRTGYEELRFPEPLDVVFTAQNYHDLAIAEYGLGERNAVNRAAFAALRPGGYYVVIDHADVAGAPVATTGQSTHRIDEAVVRREVEAAGFVFDGSSDALRNPEDDRSLNVFDPAIRGHTDQFMLRFRKPA